MLVGVLGVLGYERLLRRWSVEGFNDFQRLALASGALGFFMFFDQVLEAKGVLGMSAVGIGFFILVFRLRRRVMLRLNSVSSPVTLIYPEQ
jgi:hypothetical protein